MHFLAMASLLVFVSALLRDFSLCWDLLLMGTGTMTPTLDAALHIPSIILRPDK